MKWCAERNAEGIDLFDIVHLFKGISLVLIRMIIIAFLPSFTGKQGSIRFRKILWENKEVKML